MTFREGTLVWVAIGVAILLALAYALDFTRRRRVLERIGHAPTLMRMMASLSMQRRVLKVVVLIVAVTLIVVSVARPQKFGGKSTYRERYIDIAIVMDYSKSMLAEDLYPSRLKAMIETVDGLSDELAADRLSTVLFAGNSIHFPLTSDKSAARLYDGISPGDLAPGSDIGQAVLAARCLLRPEETTTECERFGLRGHGGDPLHSEPESGPGVGAERFGGGDRARALVLFTDGEDTAGRAQAEIERTVAIGIDVFVVGVGTPADARIPKFSPDGKTQTGWRTGPDGAFLTTRLNQTKLKELAQVAGGQGHYFMLDETGLLSELQSLERGDPDKRVVRHPDEVYQWLLFPAFLLLLIEACLGERRRKAIDLAGRRIE